MEKSRDKDGLLLWWGGLLYSGTSEGASHSWVALGMKAKSTKAYSNHCCPGTFVQYFLI